MKLSAKQRDWLQHLADHGPDTSHTPTGYFCRRKGLTEWDYRTRDGESIASTEAAKERFGDRWWEEVTSDRERITEAGRAALAQKDQTP